MNELSHFSHSPLHTDNRSIFLPGESSSSLIIESIKQIRTQFIWFSNKNVHLNYIHLEESTFFFCTQILGTIWNWRSVTTIFRRKMKN